MKIKIIAVVFLLVSISTLAFAETESETLNKRLINDSQKVWDLSLTVQASLEEANKYISISNEKGEKLPIVIIKDKIGDIYIKHSSDYEKGKTYTLKIDGKIKSKQTGKTLGKTFIIPFEYGDYEIAIEPGITQFQRLVKIQIADAFKTYEVKYKDETLKYREKDSTYIALIDTVDEEEILNNIVVQEKTVGEGEENDKNTKK